MCFFGIRLTISFIEPRSRKQSDNLAGFLEAQYSVLDGGVQYKVVEKELKFIATLVSSIQMVHRSAPLFATGLRGCLVWFQLSIASEISAGFSKHTVFKYWPEQYNNRSVYAVEESAYMQERYNFSLQFILRSCHIQVTVCR